MKAQTSREELSTGRYHIDALAVGDGGRVAMATSSLTTDLWDGCIQVLRWPSAVSGAAEVAASFTTPSGNADVAWLTQDALVAAGDDGAVSIWQLPPQGATASAPVAPLRLAEHTDVVTCVGVGAEGSRVASGSLDGTIRLWDAAAGLTTSTSTLDHTRAESYAASQVHALQWTGEQRLASGSADGVLRWWDLRAPHPLAAACAAEDGAALLSVCAVADGDAQRVVVGTEAGGVVLADARQPKAALLRTQPHGAPVCVLRHTDGAQCGEGGGAGAGGGIVASGSDDGSVLLLAARDLQCEARLAAHDDFARALAWLPQPPGGGAALLSGGWDKRLVRHALQF